MQDLEVQLQRFEELAATWLRHATIFLHRFVTRGLTPTSVPRVPARERHDAVPALVSLSRTVPRSSFISEDNDMFFSNDDCAKRRLTEPLEIMTAVSILRSRGVGPEDMITEMLKFFYVDLDEFNRVIASNSGSGFRPFDANAYRTIELQVA